MMQVTTRLVEQICEIMSKILSVTEVKVLIILSMMTGGVSNNKGVQDLEFFSLS